MTTETPEIKTERLRMRWVTEADVPLMLAIWNDPTFVRYVGDRGIRTNEEALEELANGAFRSYRDFGYGPFHVSLRDGGDGIGVCGLYKRDHYEDPDIGFAFLPDYCSQGYGWEAARAVRDYARNDLGLSRIIAIVSPDNTASIALCEKLGLTFERQDTYPDDDEIICVYAIEWGDGVSE